MKQVVETSLVDLRSQDKEAQNRAFQQLLPATDKPVDWAYDKKYATLWKR